MTAVEDRLAAIFAEHVQMWVNGGDETGVGALFRCSCLGWEFTNTRGGPEGEGEVYEHHHRHVAAVIASADDLAVIELPKPDDGVWSTECGEKVWLGENPEDPIVYAGTPYADGGQPVWHYPSEARSLAIATLAAAKTAEAVSDR